MTLLTVTVLVALTMAGRALQTSWKEERYRRRRRKRVVPGGTNGSERRMSERGSGRTRFARGRGWKLEPGRRRAPRGWTGPEGEGTGTGTRERRNTNRLDVDGGVGVGVGPDMAEASRLPEVAKEMKCLPAGEAALPPPPPGVSTPPSPSHRNRRSSPGFPEFSSFQGT